MKKKSLITTVLTALLSVSILAGCASKPAATNSTQEEQKTPGVVNVYTERNYDVDKKLYEDFEQKTGIKVNIIEGKGDELLERLVREGQDSEADMFITADAGKLHKAKEQGVL